MVPFLPSTVDRAAVIVTYLIFTLQFTSVVIFHEALLNLSGMAYMLHIFFDIVHRTIHGTLFLDHPVDLWARLELRTRVGCSFPTTFPVLFIDPWIWSPLCGHHIHD